VGERVGAPSLTIRRPELVCNSRPQGYRLHASNLGLESERRNGADFERYFAPGDKPAALRHELRRFFEPHVPDASIDALELIVSELLTNVERHARSGATIQAHYDDGSAEITVTDEGPGYEPGTIAPPTAYSEHGYGLWLVHELADEFRLHRLPGGGTSAWVAVHASPRRERDETELRLTNLQAITDTALTRLDVDDLLDELLSRVREILDADTAAILLLDDASGELVARAARGIEEEVRQGVRIPLGHGFAGRIAATRRSLRLERVDETTVANSILWEKGIRVMLGVPLMSGDTLLGVLHVGRLEPRPFHERDAALLEVVGERVAAATQARQQAVDRAAADLLERSLLPPVLPSCPGLELTARYVPAEKRTVGGDWYDVFTLPSGDLWIVVGDVAGHGLAAAVVMGRIRSALRAFTVLDLPPAEVLRLLDRKMQLFEMGTIATVAVACTAPPFERMELAVAGHPPPVIARGKTSTDLVPTDRGLPLGAWTEAPRSSTTFGVDVGDVLLFYTDGLVERRQESIEVGLERLRRAVTARDVRGVASDVMRALIGNVVPQDDIALVVARRTAVGA